MALSWISMKFSILVVYAESLCLNLNCVSQSTIICCSILTFLHVVHPVLIILINKTVFSNINVSWLQCVKLWVWLLGVLHSLEHICSTTFLVVFWLSVGPLSIQKWSASFSIKWNAYMKASFRRTLTAVDMSPERWPMLYVEVPSCLSTET